MEYDAYQKRMVRKYRGVSEFNDAESTTHVDVMSMFDRAIALAESEGN